MRFQLLTPLVPLLSYTTALNIPKRAPCTVLTEGYEAIDDAIAINSAIRECGNGGTIILPADNIYSIRSPIDFAGCRSCDVQLEGTLYFSIDANTWGKQSSYITISNINGARFRSVTGTGVLDGNAQTLYQRTRSPDPWSSHPPLVLISNSTNIAVEGLTAKNAIRHFFSVDALSSHVSLSDLRVRVENQWKQDIWTKGESIAFQFRNSSFVSLRNVDVDFRSTPDPNVKVGVCVGIDYATSDISIDGIKCYTSDGVTVQFGSFNGGFGREPPEAQWARDIRVSNYTANTLDNSGIKNMLGFSYARVSNVTFDGVEVVGGAPVTATTCYLIMRSVTGACSQFYQPDLQVNFSNIWFRNYRGNLAKPSLNCPWNSTCDFHVEGWEGQGVKLV